MLFTQNSPSFATLFFFFFYFFISFCEFLHSIFSLLLSLSPHTKSFFAPKNKPNHYIAYTCHARKTNRILTRENFANSHPRRINSQENTLCFSANFRKEEFSNGMRKLISHWDWNWMAFERKIRIYTDTSLYYSKNTSVECQTYILI